MPYRIYPLNLTSGDQIPQSFPALIGFENPGSGDPPDALLTLTCRGDPANHSAHSLSDQRGQGAGSWGPPLEHTAGSTGVTIRGSICSMDPFLERDAFEVSDITILGGGYISPVKISPVRTQESGGVKVTVLDLKPRAAGVLTFEVAPANYAQELYVFFQFVRRHGVVYIAEPHHLLIPGGEADASKRVLTVQVPKSVQDAPVGRTNVRGLLLAADGVKFARTFPWPF